MTPQEEADFREIILRLQADSTFQAIRQSVLEWVLESLVRKSRAVADAQIPDGVSIHQFVMKHTLDHAREKMRVLADDQPDMASAIARILEEYEKS